MNCGGILSIFTPWCCRRRTHLDTSEKMAEELLYRPSIIIRPCVPGFNEFVKIREEV